MTSQQPQQPKFLLIKPSEFTELANVHTEGISPARIFEISIAVKDRSRPAPSPQPTDFSNAEINDWIDGVGDITTEYEKNFIRRYGQMKATIRNATLDEIHARYVDAYLNPDNYNEINAKEVYQFIESLRSKGGERELNHGGYIKAHPFKKAIVGGKWVTIKR